MILLFRCPNLAQLQQVMNPPANLSAFTDLHHDTRVPPRGSDSSAAADVTFPVTESNTAWPDMVKFYDRSDDAKAFTLDWEIKVGANWLKVDETKHQVYVTLADPKTGLRQETLFYLSAKNADGKTTEQEVHDAVWSEFTDCEVKRIDGTQLTYYNTFLAGQRETAQLLKDGDGECTSWAKFFIDLR